MAINRVTFEYCVNNLLSLSVSILKREYPEKDVDFLMNWLMSSKTYENLLRKETGLWKQGPNYIISLFEKEKGIKIKVLHDAYDK